MILNEEKSTVETNMKLQSANFGIKDMSKIFDILQNKLYSNKKQVIVQEYMCNGRDATRELQSKNPALPVRPIEVTVPSILSLFFKVRDFGPGISEERMFDVFINYGASTKTHTNEQTGGFGLGAKSAFAYSSSFEITTFIDGIKTVYLAHVGENKAGKLSPMSQTTTTEPNGTEISIPVQKHDVQDFINATLRASYFWKVEERPVIKNLGDTQFHDWAYQIGDVTVSSYPTKGYHYGGASSYLLVDGIIYPMEDLAKKINKDHDDLLNKISEMFNSKGNIFFQVPNGFVEVGASRERVEETEFTFKNLVPLLKKNYLKVKADFEKRKTFTSFEEAINGAKEVSQVYNVHSFKVGNWTLEISSNNEGTILSSLLDKVNVANMIITDKGDYRENKSNSKRRYYGSSNTLKKIDLSHVNDGKVIHLDGATESSVILNRKIKQYMLKNKFKNATVLRLDHPELTQVQKDEIIATLKAVSVNTMPYDKQVVIKAKKNIDHSLYPLYQYTTRHNKEVKNFTKEMLDEVKQIVYVPFEVLSSYSHFASLGNYYSETMFVGATKMVLKKLQMLPNAISFETWEKSIVLPEKEIKGYIASQLIDNYYHSTCLQTNILNFICQLDGVTAPKIKDLANDYKPYLKAKNHPNLPSLLVDKISKEESVKKVLKKIEDQVTMVKQTYPLLSKISLGSLSPEEKEDLINYLNSKK